MQFELIKALPAEDLKLRALLRENIIGTSGKSMVYQHQQTDAKLDHIADPYFVTVGKGNSLLGTCCFCYRVVWIEGVPVKAYYIRYFTFRKGLRSSIDSRRSISSNGLLRKEVELLLKGKLFKNEADLYYAYIDPNNLRSVALAESFGFIAVGVFHTVFFSRLFPKRFPDVKQASVTEYTEVIDKLKQYHAKQQLLSFENIGFQNQFFVIREGGELVAGLQASPESWKVLEVPGIGGTRILQLLARLPVLNKLFGANFNFLSVEGVFFPEGREELIERLLHDVLARFNLATAVCCLDPGSDSYKGLRSLNKGIMGKVVGERIFQVMVRHQGSERVSNAPCYVSAFDVM